MISKKIIDLGLSNLVQFQNGGLYFLKPYEDLKRFKYLKRLINRYIETGELAERLILNHLIIIFNVFEFEPALRMCEFKFNQKHLSVLKPFLIHQKYIKHNDLLGIEMDKNVVEVLRK